MNTCESLLLKRIAPTTELVLTLCSAEMREKMAHLHSQTVPAKRKSYPGQQMLRLDSPRRKEPYPGQQMVRVNSAKVRIQSAEQRSKWLTQKAHYMSKHHVVAKANLETLVLRSAEEMASLARQRYDFVLFTLTISD